VKTTSRLDRFRLDLDATRGLPLVAGSGRGGAIRAACLVVIVALSLARAFLGLDLTDTGFVATNQRLIFSAPSSVAYWFHLWLTNVIGGVVDLAFGRYGIVPMKLASAVIFWCTVAAIRKLYGKAVDSTAFWLGVAATAIFGFVDKINIVHYNNLSALFFAVGAWFLVEGSVSRKGWAFFASGFALALNAFVRLPNALGLGLPLIPLLLGRFGRSEGDPYPMRPGEFAIFAAGAFAAVASALAAMAMLGHLGPYRESISALLAGSGDSESSYGGLRILSRVFRDTRLALFRGALFSCFIIALSLACSCLKRPVGRAIAVGAVAVACSFFLFFMGHGDVCAKKDTFHAIAGMGYIAATAILFLLRSPGDYRLRLAAAVSAAVVFALNFGSDTGIKVSTYAFPMLYPAVLALLSRLAQALGGHAAEARLPSRTAQCALPVFLAIMMPLSAYGASHCVYRDTLAEARFVRNPMLSGVLTSSARAEALEEVLPVVSTYAPPGSALLAFDSVGLIHFATRTRPFLNNPWPALYPPAELDRLLREKERSGPLPPVLLAKSNPRSDSWPSGQAPLATIEPITAFLDRNAYRVAWESGAFSLLLPKNNER
jgi:hypothetical protein